MKRTFAAFTAAIFIFLAGCTPSPEPFALGSDQCDHCRMQISDGRFGGQVITGKGRILKFDSLHCLIGYLKTSSDAPGRVLVSDYLNPGSFVAVEHAFFLRSDGVKDPMGPGIAATADEAGLKKLKQKMGGEWLDWAGVLSSSR
jgi:copper chaperone NosL